MFSDVIQGFFLMLYLTFEYNAITCMCHTYRLRSHVNQKPKVQETKARLKIEMHLEIREKVSYCIRG